MLVAGEAGIGKTRLVREFAATLSHGRALVAVGRCSQVAAQPFGPVLKILRSLAGTEPRRHRAPPCDVDAAAQGEWLAMLADDLLEFASRRTTVAFIEDLHWADAATSQFVLHLAQRLEGARLLLVATYRDDELDPQTAQYVEFSKLLRERSVRHLDLRSLLVHEARAFIDATLEGRAALPRGVLLDVERRGDGNPLFLEEMLRNAVERTPGAPIDSDLPLSLKGLVLERLRRLTESERAILTHAAVLGRGFTAGSLVSLLGVSEERVLPALRRARELQLLTEHANGGISYEFRHALTRDAIYATLLAAERRPLHARIAATLEALPNAGERIADLAYHWWEARDDARAAHFNELAGDHALEMHAYDDAAACYGRALEAAERRHEPRGALYEKLAVALGHDGRVAEMRRALAMASKALETEGKGDRATRLQLDRALLAQVEGNLPAGFATLEGVESARSDDGSAPHVRVTAAYLSALRENGTEALDLIRSLGEEGVSADPAAAYRYWEVTGFVAVQHSDLATWRVASRRYLDLAEQSGDRRRLADARVNVAIGAMQIGDEATVAEHLERGIADARELRMAGHEAYVTAFAALNDFVRGHLASARSRLSIAFTLRHGWAVANIARAAAGLVVGRALCDDEVVARCADERLVEAALRSGTTAVYARLPGAYAQYLIDAGRPEEARDLIHRIVAELRGTYGTFLTMPVIAEYGDARDVADARRLVESAAEDPQNRVMGATLHLFRALWERRAGDARVAAHYAMKAARRYRSLGWASMEARALDLAGERKRALALYAQVGNVRDARRIELKLSDAGAPATGGKGLLSPRELSVARLVATGKSNAAIAELLNVSRKSVERHVSSIFAKLGFRSRTELAAYIASAASSADASAHGAV